jgi:hypothetical protein
MADFPRTILPESCSALFAPGALKERSHSGIMQIRATKAVGWSWNETLPLLSVRNSDHMTLYMFVQKMWNRGEIHEFTHPLVPGSGISRNGVGTVAVAVKVKGGSQTGSNLVTDGWGNTVTNSVRAGDAIKITGDNAVYIVTADADSNGSGEVTIPISPPLRTSPDDDAVITTTNVKFRATITNRSRFESSLAPQYYAGMSYDVVEVL